MNIKRNINEINKQRLEVLRELTPNQSKMLIKRKHLELLEKTDDSDYTQEEAKQDWEEYGEILHELDKQSIQHILENRMGIIEGLCEYGMKKDEERKRECLEHSFEYFGLNLGNRIMKLNDDMYFIKSLIHLVPLNIQNHFMVEVNHDGEIYLDEGELNIPHLSHEVGWKVKFLSQDIEELIEKISSMIEQFLELRDEEYWMENCSTWKSSKEYFQELQDDWEKMKQDGFYFLKEDDEIKCLVPGGFTYDVMEGKLLKDGEFYDTMENSSELKIEIINQPSQRQLEQYLWNGEDLEEIQDDDGNYLDEDGNITLKKIGENKWIDGEGWEWIDVGNDFRVFKPSS